MFNRLFGMQKKVNTASIAKERLQIIVAHERSEANQKGPEFLADLQQDILAVVRKYMEITDDHIKVTVEREGNSEILELNITLNPDGEE